jgi:hypothetical protein
MTTMIVAVLIGQAAKSSVLGKPAAGVQGGGAADPGRIDPFGRP